MKKAKELFKKSIVHLKNSLKVQRRKVEGIPGRFEGKGKSFDYEFIECKSNKE